MSELFVIALFQFFTATTTAQPTATQPKDAQLTANLSLGPGDWGSDFQQPSTTRRSTTTAPK